MTRQLEPFFGREHAMDRIEEVGVQLRSWQRTKGTDSKAVEGIRHHDMWLAGQTLTNLHYHLHPDLRIDITTGEEPVDGSTFAKDTYDFINERLVPLEPGTTIPFQRIEKMQYQGERGSRFYIGGYAVMLSLPTLAETMVHGGGLALVPANEGATL